MPDPIEELRHVTAGVDVDPLPAAEVRRRGDRRRRRTNALATLGGVAAAAALVVPLALATRGTDRSDLQPVGPSPSTASSTAVPGLAWRQRIPAGLDLTALPAGATFSLTPRDAGAVQPVRLCGRTVLDTGARAAVPAVDTAGAAHSDTGTEFTTARTLALYRDDATAATVVATVEDAVRACPAQRQDPGASLVHDVVDTTLPADQSFVFTQQIRMDARLYADLTLFQVARVGNAVYVATSHTSAGGPQVVDGEVRRMAEQSAPVLGDLCTFAADRC